MQLTDDTLSLRAGAEEGHAVALCGVTAIPLSSPLPLHLYLSYSLRLSVYLLCGTFFWGFFGGEGRGGGYWPSSLSPYKPFLIFLSVINLYLTDSILLYPTHIFFHLPPCLSPSSIALSHRMLESQWTGYKNMNSTSEKESVILSSFRPAGLVLIFQEAVFFYTSSSQYSNFSNILQSHLWVTKIQKSQGSEDLCHVLWSLNTWLSHIFQEQFLLSRRSFHKACCSGKKGKKNQSVFCWFGTIRFYLFLSFKRIPVTTNCLGSRKVIA